MPDDSHPAEIGVTELAAWHEAGRDFALLDVREDWEIAICALPGATHIPMQQVPARKEDLPDDKPLVVMCHHGGRSMQVTRWLRQQGFNKAQSMAGGIDAWAAEIDPSLPRY